MITGVLLATFSFWGYILMSHSLLKVPLRLSPLFTVCSLMILLYWAGLANIMGVAGPVLLIAGVIFAVCIGIRALKLRVFHEDDWRDSLVIFGCMMLLAYVTGLCGRLSVIDDYAYWAIISKSMIYFDGLPTAGTSIFERHLTYTPGLALFHYFFFSGTSEFYLPVAYYAQNLLLVSLVFSFTEKQNKSASIVIVSVIFMLLLLFSGSVMQKLRVDHFLYLTTASVLWMYFRNTLTLFRLLPLCLAIASLFLIKEVGMMLAIFLLLVVFTDVLLVRSRRKIKWWWLLVIFSCLLGYLLIQKWAWGVYCAGQGFPQFHSSISLKNALQALNILAYPESRNGLVLFIKAMTFGAADRLLLPYLVWYSILACIWWYLLKYYDAVSKKRSKALLTLAAVFFILYLLMNYVMQVVIFGLGSTTEETTSLERYVNIFFCSLVIFSVVALCIQLKDGLRERVSKLHLVTGVLALVLVLASSIPHQSADYEKEIIEVGDSMGSYLDESSSVCITPGETSDHYIGFRLLFQLFPTRFNVDHFPQKLLDNPVDSQIRSCDYLFVYKPDWRTLLWFKPYTSDSLSQGSLFKVEVSTDDFGKVALKKIAEL